MRKINGLSSLVASSPGRRELGLVTSASTDPLTVWFCFRRCTAVVFPLAASQIVYECLYWFLLLSARGLHISVAV